MACHGWQMAQGLTGYEVLEIAENLERNAARFYRKAAEICDDPQVSRLFDELARWEMRHVQVFVELREYLSEKAWELGYFQPERVNGAAAPVPAVFGAHADPAKILTGRESKTDVLRMALRHEEYTLAYYTSLVKLTLGERNLEAVQEIMREEQNHVKILTRALS
jgi:rubrerythrin